MLKKAASPTPLIPLITMSGSYCRHVSCLTDIIILRLTTRLNVKFQPITSRYLYLNICIEIYPSPNSNQVAFIHLIIL